MFFQIGKQRIFLNLVGNSVYSLNMRFIRIFDIDQDIIQIYNIKNIQLFSQNLNEIFLEYSRSIKQIKKHDLILKIVILSLEVNILFITFANSYLIISIC